MQRQEPFRQEDTVVSKQLVEGIMQDVLANMLEYAHKMNISTTKNINPYCDLDEIITYLPTPLFKQCGKANRRDIRDDEIDQMNQKLRDLYGVLNNIDAQLKDDVFAIDRQRFFIKTSTSLLNVYKAKASSVLPYPFEHFKTNPKYGQKLLNMMNQQYNLYLSAHNYNDKAKTQKVQQKNTLYKYQ